jgi:iron complex transport system substrate-binding protein
MVRENKLLILVLIFTLSIAFSSCSHQPEERIQPSKPSDGEIEYPIEIVDSYDRTIKIETEPMRIISIAPSITETIFALGGGDKLIGRTEFCNYPDGVKDIESIGSLQEPSIEKIIDLKPDLIIASTHFKEETLKKLEELDVKVVVFYGEESFDGVYEVIEKVGQALNKNNEAYSLVSNMKDRVSNVVDRVKDLEKKEVYYVVGFGEYGDYTAGSDTFIGNMIEMAGGKNAAADIKGWKYSLESLVEKDPDILICSIYDDTKEKLVRANGYKELTAVKEGEVYEIDKNLLELQGPRLVDGLEALAGIVHPIK